MIIAWARKDDPDAHRRNALELRRLEAEAAVHGRLDVLTLAAGGDGTSASIVLLNTGSRAFDAHVCRWFVEWNERFDAARLRAARGRGEESVPPLPTDYEPPSGEIILRQSGRLPPGESLRFTFSFSRTAALEHVTRAGVDVAGFNGNFAHYRLEVPVRGEMGRDAVIVGRIRTSE